MTSDKILLEGMVFFGFHGVNPAEQELGQRFVIDLEAQRLWDDDEDVVAEFEIDPFRRQSLLDGLDEIGMTLTHEDEIAEYEKRVLGVGG